MGWEREGHGARPRSTVAPRPLPLPPPLMAGSGEALASPAGVQGAAPPGRAPPAAPSPSSSRACRSSACAALARSPSGRSGARGGWWWRSVPRPRRPGCGRARRWRMRRRSCRGWCWCRRMPAGDAAALERLALWALRFTPLVARGRRGWAAARHHRRRRICSAARPRLREEVLARLGAHGPVGASAPWPARRARRWRWCGPGWGGRGAAGRGGSGRRAAVAGGAAPGAGAGRRLAGARPARRRQRGGAAARRRWRGASAPALVRALDEALGRAPRPIRPIRPPPEMAVARDFADPVVTREAIEAALGRPAGRRCAARCGRPGAARGACCCARIRVDGDGAGGRDRHRPGRRATRSTSRGCSTGSWSGWSPDCGFDRITLEAPATEPLTGVQGGPGHGAGARTRREELAQLLDRLSQRLSRSGAWRRGPATGRSARCAGSAPSSRWRCRKAGPRRPRPVRLLRRPPLYQAVALLPDAPPSLLRIGPRRPCACSAPRGRSASNRNGGATGRTAASRDYYRVELASGARLWVCRIGLAEARDGGALGAAWASAVSRLSPNSARCPTSPSSKAPRTRMSWWRRRRRSAMPRSASRTATPSPGVVRGHVAAKQDAGLRFLPGARLCLTDGASTSPGRPTAPPRGG